MNRRQFIQIGSAGTFAGPRDDRNCADSSHVITDSRRVRPSLTPVRSNRTEEPTTLRYIDYIPAPPLRGVYDRALLRCIASERALPHDSLKAGS